MFLDSLAGMRGLLSVGFLWSEDNFIRVEDINWVHLDSSGLYFMALVCNISWSGMTRVGRWPMCYAFKSTCAPSYATCYVMFMAFQWQ